MLLCKRYNYNKNSFRKKVIKCSYYDSISYNMHNRMFYIYYLGHYYNKKIYHYGETDDIYMTEYKIKKTFPIYDNIICIPVEDVVYGINDFEIFISKYKTIMPLIEPKITENWDVFEFNDDVNIISNTAKKMYKIKDEVS